MAVGYTQGQTTLPAPTGTLTPAAQQQWISGISEAEGYNVPGSIPQQANNPGDLKNGDIGYGTINGITIYPSAEAGTAALANQVNNFYTPPPGGNYNPDMPLDQIASVYTGNDNAASWANTVSQSLGTTSTATPNQVATGAPSPSAPGISQSSASTNSQVQANNPEPDPIMASPLPNQTVSAETQAALTNSGISVPDQAGLNTQPWYADTNILTGNPHLHKMGFPQGFPIVFEVYMDQNNTNSLLTSTSGSSTPGAPIQIPLNCSLTQFKVSSKHVFNRQPTRTGYHITMWGMAADLIEGSGSTGLFMNQFGVTDFLSLAGINSDAVQAVLGAYSTTPSGVDVTEVGISTGNPISPATALTQQVASYNAIQIATNGGASDALQQYVEPFRIAAEDAFQEFLALFKMNATTWLHPSGYSFDSDNNNAQLTQNNANQTQALATYSTGIGATDFEIKARNNDVHKRGYVVMKFRNSQYLGYFKALSWVMDANNPYQWKFNFVFQVERTLTLVYYPSPQIAPMASNTVLAGA